LYAKRFFYVPYLDRTKQAFRKKEETLACKQARASNPNK